MNLVSHQRQFQRYAQQQQQQQRQQQLYFQQPPRPLFQVQQGVQLHLHFHVSKEF